METGIKALDKCISRYGLKTREGSDALQKVTLLRGGEKQPLCMSLPFCFRQQISALSPSTRVRLHELFMPWRNERLASFLVDEKGVVLEQVYYPRDVLHVNACRRVQRWLSELYQAQWQSVA